MTKNIPKADLDFEQDLWNSADELRGVVAEKQYKDYVLSLIFIKHLAEWYVIRMDELWGLMKDPGSSDCTTDKNEMADTIEELDEYPSKSVHIVAKETFPQYLQDNVAQDDIKVRVEDVLDKLQEVLDTYQPCKSDLLPRIFVKSQLTPRQIGDLLNLFSQKKFSERENPESDKFGRIYEYYLGKFVMAEGSGAGQSYTPGAIVRLLVQMLELSMKIIKAHSGNMGNNSVYGQERYGGSLRLRKMNLIQRDLPFDIRRCNSLLDDIFPDLMVDYMKTDDAMPTNIRGEKTICQKVVVDGRVDCIMCLQDKQFMTTGIPARLFFLIKDCYRHGEHRGYKNEIIFTRAGKMEELTARPSRVFFDDDIIKIANTYRVRRNVDSIVILSDSEASVQYHDTPGCSKSATLDEVQVQDYQLTPGIYAGTEDEKDDGIPFEEKMEMLKSKLQVQFRKSLGLQENYVKP